MPLTQKCLYALRALLELAARYEQGPARIGDLARAQSIPPRFLEVILNELKQGGFAESRRGKEGGYTLARPPAAINLGEVIRFVEGTLCPVDPPPRPDDEDVFAAVWRAAEQAIAQIYDGTTLADLAERQREITALRGGDFMI
jgi:Rrf2 family protein